MTKDRERHAVLQVCGRSRRKKRENLPSSGRGRSKFSLEGDHVHIFVFTDLENNSF
jgi:hypothetical protein